MRRSIKKRLSTSEPTIALPSSPERKAFLRKTLGKTHRLRGLLTPQPDQKSYSRPRGGLRLTTPAPARAAQTSTRAPTNRAAARARPRRRPRAPDPDRARG